MHAVGMINALRGAREQAETDEEENRSQLATSQFSSPQSVSLGDRDSNATSGRSNKRSRSSADVSSSSSSDRVTSARTGSRPEEPQTPTPVVQPARKSSLIERLERIKLARGQTSSSPTPRNSDPILITPIVQDLDSTEGVVPAGGQLHGAAVLPGTPPILPLGASAPMTEEEAELHRELINDEYTNCAFLFDGDFQHVKVGSLLASDGGEILAKTHGGASMTQSPCDTGHGHAIMRAELKNSAFRHGDQYSDPPGAGWAEIKKILAAHLTTAMNKSAWKGLCYVNQKVEKAFSTSNVISGFDKSGLCTRESYQAFIDGRCPHWCDVDKILGINPHFNKLNDDDAKFVIESIPGFAKSMAEDGLLYETVMDEKLRHCEGADNNVAKPEHLMPFNNQAMQYQRAAIINNCALRERYPMLAEDKAAKKLRLPLDRKEDKFRKELREAAQQQSRGEEAGARPTAVRVVTETSEQEAVVSTARTQVTQTASSSTSATRKKPHVFKCTICNKDEDATVEIYRTCHHKNCKNIYCSHVVCNSAFNRHTSCAH